jgi:DNA-binding HxlR family transcriptional regulator
VNVRRAPTTAPRHGVPSAAAGPGARRYSAPMVGRRTYDDACAAAHALDLVGERWALLVVRELLLGPKRFTDLRTGMPAASPNVLSQRLRDLEAAGVVRRRRLAPPAGSRVYELTEWGRGLGPLVTELARWGSRSPTLPRGGPLSADALALAISTRFDDSAAPGFRAEIALELGEDGLAVSVADGRADVVRGAPHAVDRLEPDVDAVVRTTPAVLAAVLWGGRPLTAAQASGELTVRGATDVVRRFATLFRAPRALAPEAANA